MKLLLTAPIDSLSATSMLVEEQETWVSPDGYFCTGYTYFADESGTVAFTLVAYRERHEVAP